MFYYVYHIVINGCMYIRNMVNILYSGVAIIVSIGYFIVCVVMI